jgi:hypothetical protein
MIENRHFPLWFQRVCNGCLGTVVLFLLGGVWFLNEEGSWGYILSRFLIFASIPGGIMLASATPHFSLVHVLSGAGSGGTKPRLHLRKRHIVLLLLSVLALLVLYVGTFSYWWMSSKSYAVAVGGKRLRRVELHHSDFMARTQAMWEPALWFVVHVRGYQYVGYIAAFEDSAFVYDK